ncbi:MAG TPA: hypothetical protein VGP33_14990 [Chloroflexota bacterium]|nr:hypothetical protein [Chloroflexota bacterium]
MAEHVAVGLAGALVAGDANCLPARRAAGNGASAGMTTGGEVRAAVLVYLNLEDGRDAAAEGRTWFAPYVCEILAHAGLSFDRAGPEELADGLAAHRLLILPDAPLSDGARNTVTEFARHGGILGIGGTSGLDALFGVSTIGALGESYGQVTAEHPITGGVTSSLHCWGGAAVTADSATQVLLRQRAAPGAPLLCRSRRAVLVAADLPGTLVRLQQGVRIHQDGAPAPDGSAAVDDGVLKTDDGIALDWVKDREEVAGNPCFLEPVGDDWRDLLLRSVFALAQEIGVPLPLLWYWPEDLPAVALLSHDTDGNIEALAWQELAAVERYGIQSSWCFIRYPETYPLRFYQTVAAHGHEVCLHYDAHSSAYPDSTFSEASFQAQLRWLQDVLPATPITSNKNHYLRWEGWTEPWRWMEAAGITVDQCKGPSKTGNCGFLFGGCHPWFPLEDAANGSRFLDVLEVNLFAQDLIVAAPPELAEPLVLRTRARGGVAHFLFHPAHVAKPGVADAMGSLITFAQAQGLPWWTSDRIGRWERARRQVQLSVEDGRLQATSPEPLPSATLLVLDTGDTGSSRRDQPGWDAVERWGFPFWRRIVHLPNALALPASASGRTRQ